MYLDPGGEGGVINGNDTVGEARSLFGGAGRWSRRRVHLRV